MGTSGDSDSMLSVRRAHVKKPTAFGRQVGNRERPTRLAH